MTARGMNDNDRLIVDAIAWADERAARPIKDAGLLVAIEPVATPPQED